MQVLMMSGAVELGGVASKMIPKSCYGLLRYLGILEAISIVIEDGKLVSVHYKGRWLCLDPTPDVSDSLLEYCCDRRMNLAFFIISHYIQGFRDC